MNYKIIIGIIAIFISFGGYLFTIFNLSKNKKTIWFGYILTIIWPLLFSITIIYLYGNKLILLFLVSALTGMIGEFFAGTAFKKTTGENLWDYKRITLNGQTSALMIPLWGSAGILFWFFAQIFQI